MPDNQSDLRLRLGGRWFGSWPVWLIAMAFGLLLLMSEFLEAATLRILLAWMLTWVLATALSAAVMLVLHRTLLRTRDVTPLPVAAALLLSGAFGLFYGAALWASSTALGLVPNTPWPFRLVATTVTATWLIPFLTISIASVTAARDQRRADVDSRVTLELVRMKERNLAIDLRQEVQQEVSHALAPLRNRLEAMLKEMPDPLSLDDSVALSLREGAASSVRSLSHTLWRATAAKYPRTPWERILVRTIDTQPFRTWLLVLYFIVTNGIITIAQYGTPGLIYAVVLAAGIGVICVATNALMRALPRWHAGIFSIGLLALIGVDVVSTEARRGYLGEDVQDVTTVVAVTLTVVIVLLTSAFGAWTSEQDHVRSAFRADVDAGLIAELARSRELASIARDAARTLHGSLQTRLVACAIAIERAHDRHDLTQALTQALDALENPFPDRQTRTSSIADEVRRKVALWGEACTFRIDVDPRVEGFVDPVTVGRIVEEGVTNAIRHGNATEVDVVVAGTDSATAITISDNGRGPQGGRPGLGSALLQQATSGDWSLSQSGNRTTLTARITAPRP